MWGTPAKDQTRLCWTPRGLTVGQTQPQELAAPQPPDTTGAEPTRTPGLHRPWTQSLYSSREDFPWADAHQEGRAEGGHPALPGTHTREQHVSWEAALTAHSHTSFSNVHDDR